MRHILEAAKAAPKKVLSYDWRLDEKIDHLLSGAWTASDLIEMQVDEEAVDEISTTASVGSGTERPLGSAVRYKDDQLEKLYRAYREHEKRRSVSVDEWISGALPTASPSLVSDVREYILSRST